MSFLVFVCTNFCYCLLLLIAFCGGVFFNLLLILSEWMYGSLFFNFFNFKILSRITLQFINFVLSFDANTAYYSGYKEPSIGGKDIFKVDVSEHAIIKDVRERYVTISGKIADGSANNGPMKVTPKIIITNSESGDEVKAMKVKTPIYSVKLERGNKYKMLISAGGFKTQEATIDLTVEDKNPSINMDFIMVR